MLWLGLGLGLVLVVSVLLAFVAHLSPVWFAVNVLLLFLCMFSLLVLMVHTLLCRHDELP